MWPACTLSRQTPRCGLRQSCRAQGECTDIGLVVLLSLFSLKQIFFNLFVEVIVLDLALVMNVRSMESKLCLHVGRLYLGDM